MSDLSALQSVISAQPNAAPAQASALSNLINSLPGGTIAPSQAPQLPQQATQGQPQMLSTGQSLPANNAPLGLGDRILQGFWDPFNAAGQFVQNSLPQSIVQPVNGAMKALDSVPYLGAVAKAVGLQPGLSNSDLTKIDANYSARRQFSGQSGIDWPRALTSGIVQAPLGAMFPEGAGALAIGAGLGAIGGALTPVTGNGNYFGQLGTNALLGAAGGALTAGATKAAGAILSPAIDSAQRKLLQAGVPLTPGQILGGAAQRTEDKATSIPVVGDLIKNAQRRSVEGFNQATYNQVLAPLGQKIDAPPGNAGLQAVENKIGQAYNDVVPKMAFKADQPFIADLTNLSNQAKSLPPQQQQAFMNTLQNQIAGKLQNGALSGQDLQGALSELKRAATGYAGDPSYDNRQLGALFNQTVDSIKGSMARNNSPDLVQSLGNADAAYARFARLRQAVASAGANNNGGVITPAQLNAAVRAQDKTVGKGATARGTALMQDWAQSGQNVLGNKYPDSGTAGRSMLGLLAGAMAGHEFAPGLLPPVAGAIGLASAPYTKIGGSIARGLLASRPQFAHTTGNAIAQFGPRIAAPVLTPSLLELANSAP